MNKVAAAVLAAAMVGSMAVPAFAETGAITGTAVETEQKGFTTVTYNLAQSYTWSIPTAVTFEESSTKTTTKVVDQEVKVEDNVINTGNSVVIKIADDEDFKIALNGNSSTTTREFTVANTTTPDTTLDKGAEVLRVASGTKEETVKLNFELKSVDTKVAGSYSGTLDFVASISNT